MRVHLFGYFSLPGYPPAEAASDKYHGVPKFDVATGKQKVGLSLFTAICIFGALNPCCAIFVSYIDCTQVTASKTPALTSVFANALIPIMEQDRAVCAITAAMPGGTGIDKVGPSWELGDDNNVAVTLRV